MSRTKSFDVGRVAGQCADIFIRYGYEGASIDQLVAGTGLLRGSLYAAFGSKRGLFIATLEHVLEGAEITPLKLDLCLVALLERAPEDGEVRSMVGAFFVRTGQGDWPHMLGKRLLERAMTTT